MTKRRPENSNEEKRYFLLKTSIFFLLLGSFFFGLYHCFMLPAFEGFDELAHYSSIAQFADTRQIPSRANAFLSSQLDSYEIRAPIFYSNTPAHDLTNFPAMTYVSFFSSPDTTVQKAREYIHGTSWRKTRYSSNGLSNWEGQHPPLYYFLLSPLYALTRHFSFFVHFALLRLASYLLAWFSIVWAVYWFLQNRKSVPHAELIASGISLWPIIFGSWYSGVARIGNDSLCVVWLTLIFILMQRKPTILSSIFIGSGLVAGSFTKGYFAAIGPAVIAFCFANYFSKENKNFRFIYLSRAALVAALFCLGTCWWYWHNYTTTGYFLGAAAEIESSSRNCFIISLIKLQFSITGLIKSITSVIVTGIMPMTSSLVRSPSIIPLSIAMLFFGFLIMYWIQIRKKHFAGIAWSPVWVVFPMIAGLIYHIMLIAISLKHWGQATGGFYLNILVVPFGVIVAYGLKMIFQRKRYRLCGIGFIVFDLCFIFWMHWANILVYAGISVPTPVRNCFGFPHSLPGFFGMQEALQRLEVLSCPIFAFCNAIIGLVCTCAGLITWTIYMVKENYFSPR